MRIGVVTLLFVLAGTATAAAQSTPLGGKYRIWEVEMDGKILTDEVGVNGTELDLLSDLFLPDDERFHDITLWGALPMLGNSRMNYWQGTIEGSGTAASGFNWSGLTFAPGATITTKYDMTSHSLMWDTPITRQHVGTGYLEASILVGYKYYSFKGEISDGTQKGAGSIRAPILSGGIRSFMQLASWLYADLEAYIQVYSLNSDVSIKYWEGLADLQINPYKTFYVGIGYRRINLDIDDERKGSSASRKLDGMLDGMFASITYRF